ncbi:MAG: hypothetical protein CVT47_02550 [Thermoplasmata archaeon HGW-Thermoplasmata-2]|nr:MAG: hypothetical protein CVT47_02550 [Thermoplasmata archaeon HGW-Thermoplasmata-2]
MVKKVVGKSGLRVPKGILENVGLSAGAVASIKESGNTIIIEHTGERKEIAAAKPEKELDIRCVEVREKDTWFDFTERSMKEGKVRFYRARHKASGDWMLKVMADPSGKATVKVSKCPPGIYSPLEGDSMVFQPSKREGSVYNIISTAYLDEKRNIRRDQKEHLEEVPEYISKESEIVLWSEATGKDNARYANHPVTLIQKDDYAMMVKQFMLQRVFPIAGAGGHCKTI